MKPATIWIEDNPATGDVKPWEVWFKVEGFPAHRVASCKTEDGARKSMAATIKRNEPIYSIAARKGPGNGLE